MNANEVSSVLLRARFKRSTRFGGVQVDGFLVVPYKHEQLVVKFVGGDPGRRVITNADRLARVREYADALAPYFVTELFESTDHGPHPMVIVVSKVEGAEAQPERVRITGGIWAGYTAEVISRDGAYVTVKTEYKGKCEAFRVRASSVTPVVTPDTSRSDHKS